MADEPGADLAVEDHTDGGSHLMRLTGALDMVSSPQLEETVRRIREDASQVILDLNQVSFMDSSGIKTILSCMQLCADSACEFLITRGSREVERVFELAGVLDLLPFAEPGNERV